MKTLRPIFSLCLLGALWLTACRTSAPPIEKSSVVFMPAHRTDAFDLPEPEANVIREMASRIVARPRKIGVAKIDYVEGLESGTFLISNQQFKWVFNSLQLQEPGGKRALATFDRRLKDVHDALTNASGNGDGSRLSREEWLNLLHLFTKQEGENQLP